MKIYIDRFDRLRLDLDRMTIPLIVRDNDDDRVEVVKKLRKACEDWLEREYLGIEKGGNMSKKYVISSSVFDSKDEALEQLQAWLDRDNLDEDAKVYEVKKVYKPVLELEEE